MLRAAPAAGRPGLSERGTARPLGRTARGLEGSDSPGHCGQLKFADHPWPSFMPSGYRKRLGRCQPGSWPCGLGRRGGAPSVHVAQRLLPADPTGGARALGASTCPARPPALRPAWPRLGAGPVQYVFIEGLFCGRWGLGTCWGSQRSKTLSLCVFVTYYPDSILGRPICLSMCVRVP